MCPGQQPLSQPVFVARTNRPAHIGRWPARSAAIAAGFARPSRSNGLIICDSAASALRYVTEVRRIMVRRRGRFTLEENRKLMSMFSSGASVEEAVAKFSSSPETILQKAAEFGVRLRKSPARPHEVRSVNRRKTGQLLSSSLNKRAGTGSGLAKKPIAAEELALVFQERLVDICGHRIPIAIVRLGDRWSAQTSVEARKYRPECVAKIGIVEAELRKQYILPKDQIARRKKLSVQTKDPAFKPGDRIRLTKLGIKNSPKLKSELGVVIGKVAGNVVRVLIEGRTTPISLHVSYVQKRRKTQ